jgi:ribosomal protein S18 acetylase RimI-like enzyme
MNIRRAQESDAPFLAKVHIDAWHAAYRGSVPDSFLQGFTYQSRAERFRQSLATGSEETYLVEENGKVMGFLTLGACRDSDLNVDCTGEIWGIYISPTHWRKGLGKRLLEEAQSLLKSKGYKEAVLWVLEGNQLARRFYEAMGFRLDGGTKEVNLGIPMKAVRYRKALGPAEQGVENDATKRAPYSQESG